MAESPVVPALKFPLGLNNRDRESALPEGTLREAVNVDITRDGGLLVRQGLRAIAAGNFHSFYGHPYQTYVLAVQDGSLIRWDGSTINALRAVHPTARMSYASLNNDVFFSNGHEQGRVTSAGTLSLWGLPTPPAPGCVAVSSTGGLRAGTLRVTQVAVVDGLESGAPEPVAVAVAEGGGVQVTVPTGATFRVYATDVDGEMFRQAATVTSGGTALIGAGFVGKPLESLFAVKPLPGLWITAFKGRLWVASGSVVWFTDTLSPHWLFPQAGYYAFEDTVTGIVAAEDGLYIGTAARVWYLQGSKPAEMTLRPVLHLGMVAGSGLNDVPTDVLLGQGAFPSRCGAFLDTDGVFCIGRPGGVVQRITEQRYVMAPAERASVAYWQHEGLRQFTVALESVQGAANQALDGLVQATFANGTALSA